MCRMVLAVGDPPWEQVFSDFLIMARDQNADHERHDNGRRTHKDGWGLAWYDNGQFQVHRSTLPCFEDPYYRQFVQVDSSEARYIAR